MKIGKGIIKIIAWFELLGGMFGIVLVAATFLKIRQNQNSVYILLIAIPFIFSLAAGYFLLIGKRIGITCSIILQALQIPKIIGWYITYFFVSGPSLGIFIDSKASIGLSSYLGSQFLIEVSSNPSGPIQIGLNILSILFLVILIKSLKVIATNNSGYTIHNSVIK
jgi:hypothetical protein